jgi:release factor glutamine methyltransferase
MILTELYRDFMQQLKAVYSTHEAANITSMCFEKVAGITKSDVIKNPESILSDQQLQRLQTCLAELLKHKPIQYVLGEAWFYHLKFKVDENVLIPRPETEELVNEVIEFINQSKVKNIIDIGTGSGCIPISIKNKIQEAMVTAIDISKNAIQIATENALHHQTKIEFIKTDFLDTNNWNNFEKFDVIISNPPYIPLVEKETMDKNVTSYEPHLALFVPDDSPLLFYVAIASFSKTHLSENGKIFMEVHENYANEVAAIFRQQGFFSTIKKDIFGKERMVTATHCR